jgi:hypothetical protein
LHAYEAANVAHELDSSDDKPSDRAGIARRFDIPTVADGRVYVGGSGEVDVYGLSAAVHKIEQRLGRKMGHRQQK